MPVFTPSKRMAFWEIQLNDIDISKEMGQSIAGITIEYDCNAPTQAIIEIMSMSFFEDFFAKNGRLTVKMGWSRSQMVTMIKDAQIIVNPEGGAKEYMSYTVTAAYPAAAMAKEKSRVHPATKPAVIAVLAGENGLIPVIDIADRNIIPAKEVPMQVMKTDMQFLVECAQKWNCLTWVDSETKTLYFVDAAKAYSYGSTIKKLNIEDLEPDYVLGYKTDFARNNVANIRWGHKSPKGGQNGAPAVLGLSESGSSTKEQNYNLEFEGVYYRVKPEYMRRIQNGEFSLGLKISGLISASGTAQARSELHQYFDPINSSHTNDNTPAAGTGAGAELSVELNVGDPYIRPPRKARLYAGSNSPKALTADLPGFLLGAKDKPGTQIFHMSKVKTSIKEGRIATDLVLTR